MVSEKGHEFYRQSTDFHWEEAHRNHFVRDNVLSQLDGCPSGAFNAGFGWHKGEGRCRKYLRDCPWRNRDQLRWDLFSFVEMCCRESNEPPQFWGYYADYDHVAIAQLFGTMMHWPDGWPMYTRDIKQALDNILHDHPGLEIELPKNPKEHHALHDARWNRWLWEDLARFEYPDIARMLDAQTPWDPKREIARLDEELKARAGQGEIHATQVLLQQEKGA